VSDTNPATRTVTLAYAGGRTVTLDLPIDLNQMTRAQRRTWGREQIECIALDVLRDFGAAYGRVPTSTQQELFLEATRPGVEAALRRNP
jgi:hypothetical protein